jgi:hypothetical protein
MAAWPGGNSLQQQLFSAAMETPVLERTGIKIDQQRPAAVWVSLNRGIRRISGGYQANVLMPVNSPSAARLGIASAMLEESMALYARAAYTDPYIEGAAQPAFWLADRAA